MSEASNAKGSATRIDVNLRTNPDPVLQDLVRLVNETNAEIDIMLTVGGILVSGKLASYDSYLEHFRADFAKACQDEDVIKGIQSKFVKDSAPKLPEETPHPPFHIHLKEAKFLSLAGNPIGSSVDVWWRGRIAEVDAFSLDTRDKTPYGDGVNIKMANY